MRLSSFGLKGQEVQTRGAKHADHGGIVPFGRAIKNSVLMLSVTGLLSFANVGHADEAFQQCLENAKDGHERSECYWARSRQQRGR